MIKRLYRQIFKPHHRKRILMYSIIPCLLLTLFAGALLVPSVLTNQAQERHKKKQYDSAAQKLDLIQDFNRLEPYKAWYNEGTVFATQGKYKNAKENFQIALNETNDPQAICEITYNLVITMEKEGDANFASEKSKFSVVTNNYITALANLRENKNCFNGDKAEDRIKQKLANMGQSGDTQQPATNSAIDPKKQAKLAELEMQSQMGHQATIKEGEDGNSGAADDLDPGINPW